MTRPRPLPLDGVTVIAVEQYGAGPFGTMLLGDLGAEVIKIENPAEGGELGRHVGPYAFSKGDTHFFQSFNRNKRSMTLNLKHPEGMDVLRRLRRMGADIAEDDLGRFDELGEEIDEAFAEIGVGGGARGGREEAATAEADADGEEAG